ncbi:MAG: precorrin-6y C5,15-methyltransferase (decarboxylating) subunit CbiE [Solirubrobacterales bacterium]
MLEIRVIGMGPGHPDYITPAARKAAAGCAVLAGAQRLLDALSEGPARRFPWTTDLEGTIRQAVAETGGNPAGILVSGDPGVYSVLPIVRRIAGNIPVRIEPGISSVQYLCSRLGRSSLGIRVLSAHGRDLADVLQEITPGGSAAAILTDPKSPPERIAAELVRRGCHGIGTVGSRLSWPLEQIVTASLAELAGMTFDGMSVMLIGD